MPPAEPSASASPTDPPRRWPPLTVWLGLCLLLIAVPWAFKLSLSQSLGEPCGGGFDCQVPDGRCVEGEQGRFCTKVCEGDDECPGSGHCGVPVHDRWQLWFSASAMSERVCIPGPRPTALPTSVAAPDAPPPSSGDAGAQFRPPEQRGGLGDQRR